MWRETNIAGVYISPLLVYMAAAGLLWVPLRWGFERLRLDRHVWNTPLVEAALYVWLLGLLVVLL